MTSTEPPVAFFIRLKQGADNASVKADLEKLAADLSVNYQGPARRIMTANTSKGTYERVFGVELRYLSGVGWMTNQGETIPTGLNDRIAHLKLSQQLEPR